MRRGLRARRARDVPGPAGDRARRRRRVAHTLEGEHRGRAFPGRRARWCEALNIVRPHAAIFGKKDYQQLLVAARAGAPAEFGVPIGRSRRDGARGRRARDVLAQRLPVAGRAPRSAARSRACCAAIRERSRGGRRDFAALEKAAQDELAAHGWRPDYVAVRRRRDLAAPGGRATASSSSLGAAWLGRTRLIDNVDV